MNALFTAICIVISGFFQFATAILGIGWLVVWITTFMAAPVFENPEMLMSTIGGYLIFSAVGVVISLFGIVIFGMKHTENL